MNLQSEKEDDILGDYFRESQSKESIQFFLSQPLQSWMLFPFQFNQSNQNDVQFDDLAYSEIDTSLKKKSNSQIFNSQKTENKCKKKKRRIKKNIEDQLFSPESLSEVSDDKGKNKQRKTWKWHQVKGCTKNILSNFRNLFIDYLSKFSEASLHDSFIKSFKQKKCINKGDFVDFFASSFRSEISTIFQTRYLNREIQLRKISMHLKRIYLKKIEVFKKAFEKKWFPKIR